MPASAKQVAQLRAEINNVKKDLAKTNKILYELITHLKLGGKNEDKPNTDSQSPSGSDVQSTVTGSNANSGGDGEQGVLAFEGGGNNPNSQA